MDNPMQQIWKDMIKNNHTWAFFYFLKKMGDNPKIVDNGKTIDIIVEKPDKPS
jgi:hypothetical protein